jgi:cytochrome c oxidase cbb3-type subunit 2
VVPQSIMPGYPFLAKTELAFGEIANELKANRLGGVPYTDEMIVQAEIDLKAQATPDHPGQSDLEKRYPKAQSRDYDGDPQRITEADALIAYLQALGTLVDFKLYDDKANIR